MFEHQRPLTRFLAVLARARARCRSERGQAMAELALVIPVLLLLVLGIVDFGRAVNYWNDTTHLANLGARFAAVGSTGSTCNGTDYSQSGTLAAYLQCEAGIDSPELKNGGGSTGIQNGVCVSVVPGSTVGAPVTVTVSANYNWLPVPMLGRVAQFAQTPISGTATMRLEQPPPSGIASTAGC
jgi:Flp pilus assembly protein TadG